ARSAKIESENENPAARRTRAFERQAWSFHLSDQRLACRRPGNRLGHHCLAAGRSVLLHLRSAAIRLQQLRQNIFLDPRRRPFQEVSLPAEKGILQRETHARIIALVPI